jgi:hypothetical protein
MHLLGRDVGRKRFVLTVKVNYLEHVETSTPKCSFLRSHYSVIFAAECQMLRLLLSYHFRTVAFTVLV